eukprot:1187944-Prorocentrum_minimum.AAC.1
MSNAGLPGRPGKAVQTSTGMSNAGLPERPGSTRTFDVREELTEESNPLEMSVKNWRENWLNKGLTRKAGKGRYPIPASDSPVTDTSRAHPTIPHEQIGCVTHRGPIGGGTSGYTRGGDQSEEGQEDIRIQRVDIVGAFIVVSTTPEARSRQVTTLTVRFPLNIDLRLP